MKNVSKYYDQARKLKVQIWSSVVNILVIECKELGYKDGEHPNKPYLRLRYRIISAYFQSSPVLNAPVDPILV